MGVYFLRFSLEAPGGGGFVAKHLGTVYLSPPNYERNSSEDLIGELEEMFLFSQKGDITVQGDYIYI